MLDISTDVNAKYKTKL
jgi:hypothetical protein